VSVSASGASEQAEGGSSDRCEEGGGCERGRGSKQQQPITHSHAALFSRSIESIESNRRCLPQIVSISAMWMCVTHTMYWSWSIVHPFDLVSRTRRVGRRAECDRTAIIGERVRHERKSSLSRIALFIRFFALHCAPPTPPPSLILSLCVPTHQEHRIEKERLVDSVRLSLSNSCLKAQELRGVLILMFLSLFSSSSV